jgi:hypothetical protein
MRWRIRYESIRPELAQRFAEAVVDTVEKIVAAPLHFALLEKGRRRAGVRRFPWILRQRALCGGTALD